MYHTKCLYNNYLLLCINKDLFHLPTPPLHSHYPTLVSSLGRNCGPGGETVTKRALCTEE